MKRKIYIPNFNQKNRYIIYAELTQLQDAAEIENKGAVALTQKLGMMSSDGGKFHPQATVTRERDDEDDQETKQKSKVVWILTSYVNTQGG